jgi:hypothetical protein
MSTQSESGSRAAKSQSVKSGTGSGRPARPGDAPRPSAPWHEEQTAGYMARSEFGSESSAIAGTASARIPAVISSRWTELAIAVCIRTSLGRRPVLSVRAWHSLNGERCSVISV